jgi:hypothetical protein
MSDPASICASHPKDSSGDYSRPLRSRATNAHLNSEYHVDLVPITSFAALFGLSRQNTIPDLAFHIRRGETAPPGIAPHRSLMIDLMVRVC